MTGGLLSQQRGERVDTATSSHGSTLLPRGKLISENDAGKVLPVAPLPEEDKGRKTQVSERTKFKETNGNNET